MRSNRPKGISLFSSGGIGEYYLADLGLEIIAANELIEKRAKVFKHFYPEVDMVVGDIRDEKIKGQILNHLNSNDVSFLLATPPCQGLSTLGKNKKQSDFEKDPRNFLVYDIFDIIDAGSFRFILIENVPRFLKMYFPYKGEFLTLQEILIDRYSDRYTIEVDVLNAKDYGVAQTRPRAIIRMFDPRMKWNRPSKEDVIALEAAIGHLPTLEAGETSSIRYHKARKHNVRAVNALKHTPPGQSALINKIHYPKKENGDRIKGFHNTFKRMVWDQPAHARTTYSASISSHNNVHPGRPLKDGTYSDARVLTLLETFIVSSLPEDIEFPADISNSMIYTLIGEAIPPLMLKKIIEPIMGQLK